MRCVARRCTHSDMCALLLHRSAPFSLLRLSFSTQHSPTPAAMARPVNSLQQQEDTQKMLQQYGYGTLVGSSGCESASHVRMS
jgi:hypothetical protein